MRLRDFISTALNSGYEVMDISPFGFIGSMYKVRKYAAILDARDKCFSIYNAQHYKDLAERLESIVSPYDLTMYMQMLEELLFEQLSQKEIEEMHRRTMFTAEIVNPGMLDLILERFCRITLPSYNGYTEYIDTCLWKVNIDSLPGYNLYFRTKMDALNFVWSPIVTAPCYIFERGVLGNDWAYRFPR